MSITYWIILIVVLVAGWWMGWIRPTGLAGRNREGRETDRRRGAAERWLDKHGDDDANRRPWSPTWT